MLLYFKRESHAPFYATALLLVLNQWSQPGRWKIANTINIAIAVLAAAVMTVRSERLSQGSGGLRPGTFDAWMNATLLPALGGMVVLLVLNELWGDKRWGSAQVHFLPRGERPDLRRTGRDPRRLRPADRRLLADRRHRLAGQRSAQPRRQQRPPAPGDVRLHQSDPRPRAHHDRLLHLPRHPDRAGPREARPQQDGRPHVHLLLGMLSSITPPVAIASFAAAGIAGAPAMKTGWESMWVGSIIYFIPFFFVANPALVLQPAAGGGSRISRRSTSPSPLSSGSPSSAEASRVIRSA